MHVASQLPGVGLTDLDDLSFLFSLKTTMNIYFCKKI